MMSDLDKYIRGHIFDIKQIADDVFAIEEYFQFTHEDMDALGNNLKGCVEGGVIEYKRKILSSVFSFLEMLQYDSKGFDRLTSFARPLTDFVYITLCQRLISRGILKTTENRQDDSDDRVLDEGDISIKEILADIQSRVRNNPGLNDDPRVKSIRLQVKQYSKEMENKRSLEPNILPDKKKAFEENYNRIAEDIFRKIREIYYSLLTSTGKKAEKQDNRKTLKDYDLEPLVPVYRKQWERFSTLRSTILYMGKERYNIRDIIVSLEEKKDEYNSLVDEEEKKHMFIAPFDGGARQLVDLQTASLIRILERHSSLLKSGL